MSETTPLSIADQLARYGDTVEAAYGPIDRRHSGNGGPVSVIDLRPDVERPETPTVDDVDLDGGTSERSTNSGRLALVAAVAVLLLVSAAVLFGIFNQPDNIVTDDIEITSTTTHHPPTSTSTSVQPDPDADDEAFVDVDAAAVPPELRALSTSSGWVPIAVNQVRLPSRTDEGDAEDQHYASEAAAFHTADSGVLYLWIVEHGSPFGKGEPSSIDAADPWGDERHSGLSWVEDDRRFLLEASALHGNAPTGSALKDVARSMTPGEAGWSLPGAELVGRQLNDGPEPASSADSNYVQITWAQAAADGIDMSRTVAQTTRRGSLTDMIYELHEASSLGPVRLLRADDGTVRFVMDEGETERYGLALFGSTVVNWQGPGGPAMDRLVTETEILDRDDWNMAWAEAGRLVGEWVDRRGDATPPVRLVPDSSWDVISAVDPSLWSPMERFESRSLAGSVPSRRRWLGAFQVADTTSPLPDVVVRVEASDGPAPSYICEGSWVATTLGSEACASSSPRETSGPGSSFLVSGDGWYINLSSPNMSIGDLAAFSNDLEARGGEVFNGFDHLDADYRLMFESDQPEQFGEPVTSTWRRGGIEQTVRLWSIDRGSFLDWMVQGTASGSVTPLENDRYLITWPGQARLVRFDAEGGYEVNVTWRVGDRDTPDPDDASVAAATELIENLTEIDRDEWRSLIEPVNEPFVDPFADVFVEVDGNDVEVDGGG